MITPHSHLEGEKYYDPKSSKLFSFNQLELKTKSVEKVDQLSYKDETRSLLEKSLDSYVEEYFSNGTAAVYTSLKNIQDSQQSQEEQDTEEESKDVESDKETAGNAKNTGMTQEEHVKEEEQMEDKEDNEDKENKEDEQKADIEDNEEVEKPEEQPEETVENKPEEESKEPEESVPAETTPVSYQNTTEDTTEDTPSEEITSINICYAGNKFNQSNYWSGRWRANWVYDLTTNELIGNINIIIHYFE